MAMYTVQHQHVPNRLQIENAGVNVDVHRSDDFWIALNSYVELSASRPRCDLSLVKYLGNSDNGVIRHDELIMDPTG